MRTVALFCSVSLAVAAWCGQSDGAERAIATANDEAAFHRAVGEAPPAWTDDPILGQELERTSETADWKAAKRRLVAAIRVKRFTDGGVPSGRVTDPRSTATKILSRPVYRDPGERKGRTWFSDWVDRLARAISDFFEKLNRRETRGGSAGSLGMGMAVLEPIVWVVLILGLLAFATVFIMKFTLGRRARRQGSALLEEHEADLNADEWLLKASELEARREFREAVRCLYLASLRRLDDAEVLRFVRTETNWEHLRRFEGAPARPEGLDLRTQTREFDRVWYGHRVNGAEDVALFRSFYKSVLVAVGRMP